MEICQITIEVAPVFPTQERAEEWADERTYGIKLQTLIDLLSTPAGIEMVETYLNQIEYGVCA